MDFNQYQIKSNTNVLYQPIVHEVIYPLLYLTCKSGVVVESIKKLLKENDGVFSIEDSRRIRMELGDVLYALAQISTKLSIQLNDIAETNLNKFTDLKERGVISGNGDQR